MDPVNYFPKEIVSSIQMNFDRNTPVNCCQVSQAWLKSLSDNNSFWHQLFPNILFPKEIPAKKYLDLHAIKSTDEIVERLSGFVQKLLLNQKGTFNCLFPFNSDCNLKVKLKFNAASTRPYLENIGDIFKYLFHYSGTEVYLFHSPGTEDPIRDFIRNGWDSSMPFLPEKQENLEETCIFMKTFSNEDKPLNYSFNHDFYPELDMYNYFPNIKTSRAIFNFCYCINLRESEKEFVNSFKYGHFASFLIEELGPKSDKFHCDCIMSDMMTQSTILAGTATIVSRTIAGFFGFNF